MHCEGSVISNAILWRLKLVIELFLTFSRNMEFGILTSLTCDLIKCSRVTPVENVSARNLGSGSALQFLKNFPCFKSISFLGVNFRNSRKRNCQFFVSYNVS